MEKFIRTRSGDPAVASDLGTTSAQADAKASDPEALPVSERLKPEDFTRSSNSLLQTILANVKPIGRDTVASAIAASEVSTAPEYKDVREGEPLRLGAKGDAVLQLKQDLNAWWLSKHKEAGVSDILPATDTFDALTKARLKEFQREFGISMEDGSLLQGQNIKRKEGGLKDDGVFGSRSVRAMDLYFGRGEETLSFGEFQHVAKEYKAYQIASERKKGNFQKAVHDARVEEELGEVRKRIRTDRAEKGAPDAASPAEIAKIEAQAHRNIDRSFASILVRPDEVPQKVTKRMKDSHFDKPIDYSDGKPHGNSRKWGDANPETQMAVIRAVISEAARCGLSEEDTAAALAMIKIECGFNPDAAANTSTAGGCGQFLNGTWAEWQKRRGETGTDRFDIETGVGYFFDAWKENSSRATQAGYKPGTDAHFQAMYTIHHDGHLNAGLGGAQIAKSSFMREFREIKQTDLS